jgi:medium-chain acyl-[acyl-carrier-protein] hydrolase
MSRWLTRPGPDGSARLRLFCFPYSGAGASIYYRWNGQLPAGIDLCPVELPGRGSRLSEPPFSRIEPLAAAAAEALLPYLDRPFALFGHSMGALACFELARLLRRHHGLQPVRLIASGHPAPHVPDREPPIHALPEPEFVAKLRALGGTPEEVLANAELRALILPILRADFSACETYTYEPEAPLDCPISAYGGLEDREVPSEELSAWRSQTSGLFTSRLFPGNHFFIHSAQPLLLRSIARDLLGDG